MKKKHTVIAFTFIMTMVLMCSMHVQAGFTPKYESPIPEIPEIHVELPDSVKEAVDQAVQKQIEKMILDKPVVSHAAYWENTTPKNTYSFLSVICDKVENATSYKVEVVKTDGSKKTYGTKYALLTTSDYYDEFVSEGIEGATARVRAFGDDETYSPWSDTVEINSFRLNSYCDQNLFLTDKK